MDKVAVVTGGSSGLGFAIAKKLAGEGHAVVLIARGKDRLEAKKQELEGAGRTVLAISADVSNIDEMKPAAVEVRERFGKIDFLAVNAGMVEPRALFTFDDLQRMKKTIDVDLWGAVLTSRVFGPMVVKGGRILFVSSAFGLCGGAGYATYCGAKAGVLNFADALRHELSYLGVRVYAAAPADIDTPQFHEEKASLPPWLSIGRRAQQRDARGRRGEEDPGSLPREQLPDHHQHGGEVPPLLPADAPLAALPLHPRSRVPQACELGPGRGSIEPLRKRLVPPPGDADRASRTRRWR